MSSSPSAANGGQAACCVLDKIRSQVRPPHMPNKWAVAQEASGPEFPKACKFATDDVITANYFCHYFRHFVTKIVEVYRDGEIIEI